MALCQLHKTLLHYFFSNDFSTINPFNILIMEQYTHEDWKAYKKAFNLTNIKVAELLGLESNTVSNLTQRRNPLPRWAVGMIYTWKNNPPCKCKCF